MKKVFKDKEVINCVIYYWNLRIDYWFGNIEVIGILRRLILKAMKCNSKNLFRVGLRKNERKEVR